MDLFAYGSLMDPEILRQVAGELPPRRPATLSGYERRRLRGQPYPGIRPREEGTVEGVLYAGLSPQAAARLDRFEGEAYRRQPVVVRLADGSRRPAEAYVLRSAEALDPEEWSFEEFLRTGKASFLAEYEGFGRTD